MKKNYIQMILNVSLLASLSLLMACGSSLSDTDTGTNAYTFEIVRQFTPQEGGQEPLLELRAVSGDDPLVLENLSVTFEPQTLVPGEFAPLTQIELEMDINSDGMFGVGDVLTIKDTLGDGFLRPEDDGREMRLSVSYQGSDGIYNLLMHLDWTISMTP